MQLKQFSTPSIRKSLTQLGLTASIFIGLWVLMWFSLSWSYWITLALALPAGGFMIRLFIIQHDCGHGSYFKSTKVNNLVGRVLGVFTLTPFDYWRREHAEHHASAGNLDRRGTGDITTLTVDEYEALPRMKRILYRLYRNPLVMFGIGPIYIFVLKHRLPLGKTFKKTKVWSNVVMTNALIVLITAGMIYVIGPIDLLKIQVPVVLIAAATGIWMFYVQHQFEHIYWRRDDEWDYSDAALLGSSHYRLPKFLQWLTGNIGIHHIHHLYSKIPNYRLPECLERIPELQKATRLTLFKSFSCVRFALLDEKESRMISFRDFKKRIKKSHG
ncbi:MAG: fatty acid desaturase [Sphingomonadales bacterium]|nr:fatty acid desaturase [Sphingomonadales bacterium]